MVCVRGIVFGALILNLAASVAFWTIAAFGADKPALVDLEGAEGVDGRLSVWSVCTADEGSVQREEASVAKIFALPSLVGYHIRLGQLCTPAYLARAEPIKIRLRGFSSLKFAKKQYGFEFLDASGDGRPRSFLGLPAAKEWALHSPYIDRSYIRNALVYRIGQKMGWLRGDPWFAPGTRFVELYLNSDYQGIYLVSERVQRGPQQIDIPKLSREGALPEDFPFIMEVSLRSPDVKTKHGTSLEYSYPSERQLAKWAKAEPARVEVLRKRLLSEVERFEDRLLGPSFADPELGYRPLLDVGSFVDYFLAQEVFKNIDGFRRSAFFYKGIDGKVHMGPLWDFDIALGNLNFWGMSEPEDWVHEDRGLPPPPLFWFKRLIEDPFFSRQVRSRYFELRQRGKPLDASMIRADIVALATDLGGEAALRDHWRWLGTRNSFQAVTLNTRVRGRNPAEHRMILGDWLLARLTWLDRHLW